jgi:hypothetical protein
LVPSAPDSFKGNLQVVDDEVALLGRCWRLPPTENHIRPWILDCKSQSVRLITGDIAPAETTAKVSSLRIATIRDGAPEEVVYNE